MFSNIEFRKKFPILQLVNNNRPIIYFDNAATTQKYSCVIEESQKFYLNSNANVHRGSHFLSAKATTLYENSRSIIADFIHAGSEKQIIWTKGTTEAINMIAHSYGLKNISAGDDIVISQAEHHANIVPWQNLASLTGANIVVLPLDSDGRIDVEQAQSLITDSCKILAVNHISNVIGKINPLRALIHLAKQHNAITVIDGAQAIAHLDVDVQELDCDFYVFSAHKMYGPTGIGVLYGKAELLESMSPYQFGGEMIKKVSFSGTTYNDVPQKFEAGTPNIVGVIGIGTCTTELSNEHSSGMRQFERELCQYLFLALNALPEIELLIPSCPDVAIFSLIMKGVHHHDLAAYLDSKGIAVRSGHHCAMPLMEHFGLTGSVRISLAAYNTFAEVDYLIDQLKQYGTDQEPNSTAVIENSHESLFVTQQGILSRFDKAKSWDLKHREIMMLAKELVRIPKVDRNDEDLISGCESKAWLTFNRNLSTQALEFEADSDAKVIRGLLVIILSVYQHKTAQQILDLDINAYFDVLGLMQHLSPSRGNGVKAIVDRINQIASTTIEAN